MSSEGAGRLVIPDEHDLVWFFSAHPVAEGTPAGFWSWSVTDTRDIRLEFSVDLYDRSIETTLSKGQERLIRVQREGLDSLVIENGFLIGHFSGANGGGSLLLKVDGGISVEWTSGGTWA